MMALQCFAKKFFIMIRSIVVLIFCRADQLSFDQLSGYEFIHPELNMKIKKGG